MKTEEIIRERAFELGFDLFGIATAEESRTAPDFRRWIAAGMHAAMGWMARDPERRGDPRKVLSGCRSLVVVGVSYTTPHPPAELWNDPLRGRIARFAWGADYHDVLTPRLKELATAIDRETAGESICYTDTGPVLERAAATAAGVGYPGYNSNLISPGHGSYILLGEVLSTAFLEPSETAESVQDVCDPCRRCISECPTNALRAPYVCDSRRCISYLTIENKGPIPKEFRPLLGNWIFGCDACQECCPQLERIAPARPADFLEYDPDFVIPDLIELMGIDRQEFRHRFAGTPIIRSKRRGLLRNVAVALGNSGNANAIPILKTALEDEEPLIREHAAWALERIASSISNYYP